MLTYMRGVATVIGLATILVTTSIAAAAPSSQPATSQPSQVLTVELAPGVKMEFASIPAGKFTMGSPVRESLRSDGETQHEVTISKPFWMQTTEVTQKQWEAVMGNNPSRFKGDDLPVERVSWNDVQDFLKKLSEKEKASGGTYRLPTEAEWECACRAGTQTRFHSGDEDKDLGEVAWYRGNSDNKTHPVATKQPNAWGLYDMQGNVWEWCQDWYGTYPNGAVADPQGPGKGGSRVLRGGSWDDDPKFCRAANRSRGALDYSDYIIGFRVVWENKPRGK